VDTETVETHLAVGNLFRRRGEVERATRIHQNLIARPSLEPLQRSQALFELAQDYLKAGLFDRAENLLLELAEVNLHSEPALKGLVQIYEQEREWEKAAATLRRLVRVTGERQDRIIAHYDCELAEEAERAGRVDEALALTRRAIGADSHCVRASKGDAAGTVRRWNCCGR
jgi:lipopolysaccharide biosynthesis regulator YciM